MNTEELTKKVIELDERTIRNTEQIKSALNDIKDVKALADSVYKMATAVEVLANAQKSTDKKVDNLTKDVEEIKEKPAKNWDNTVRLVFELILAAIVGLVLINMGLK
jgi:F0F1-type ATP synthase assembly protein I